MNNTEVDANLQITFEKFKKWVKENAVGISAVAISVGGIAVVIAIVTCRAIQASAHSAYNFWQGVAEVLSKFGPLLGELGSVFASLLSAGATGQL